MNASETKLQQIIEGEKQYVVPLFQRAYSWSDKEWKTLWDDLIDLYEQDSPRAHFIGSMVTIPTTSVPEGVAKYLLIDGQQRLTTIFVLMAVLRDRINGEELAEEIHNTLLVNPYKKGNDKLKLLPTQFDRNAFNVLIEGNTNAENGTQVIKAYKYFERQFKKNNLDIAKFKKIVTGYLSLVSIVLDPNDNPHLVFESLNAKGRPLTQSDLIRNYFFMRIHVDQQDEKYSRFWQPMQSALDENLTEYKVWPYFGDDKPTQNQMGVTGTKPVGLWILGQKFYVDTWKDVLIRTLGVIAELAPDKFEQIEQRYPRFVGKDKNNFRRSNELPNGVFVEVNLSADSIQKFCYQAIETVGLTSDDWHVETR